MSIHPYASLIKELASAMLMRLRERSKMVTAEPAQTPNDMRLYETVIFTHYFFAGSSMAGEPVQPEMRKEFHSPDGNITVIASGESSDLAELDNFVVHVRDRRNDDLTLALPGYEEPMELGNVHCEWYWKSTAMTFGWASETGKNSGSFTYVLRRDARSGVYYFEVPTLPSPDELQGLILRNTRENPRIFSPEGIDQIWKVAPEQKRGWSGGLGVSLIPEHAGIFRFSLEGGPFQTSYSFTFHTPDWLRYDLLQITRYQDKDVPGEPFAAPDSKDVLLYQKDDIPEDLRWKPIYTDPTYPDSVDLTEKINDSQESGESE